MQEVYRRFLLDRATSSDEIVKQVAQDLGGLEGGNLLMAAWKDIHAAIGKNGRNIGFALGLEYASRRTLVRPLVPDPSALLPGERDWWQAYTFGGDLRFGHAHLFRGEGGPLSQDWYRGNYEQSMRTSEVFQHASAALGTFLHDHPDAGGQVPLLAVA